jgi:hypothetical protein
LAFQWVVCCTGREVFVTTSTQISTQRIASITIASGEVGILAEAKAPALAPTVGATTLGAPYLANWELLVLNNAFMVVCFDLEVGIWYNLALWRVVTKVVLATCTLLTVSDRVAL